MQNKSNEKKREKEKKDKCPRKKENKRQPIPSCTKTISGLEKERHFSKEQCGLIFHTHALLDLRVCYSPPQI